MLTRIVLVIFLTLPTLAYAKRYQFYFVTTMAAGGKIGIVVDGPKGQMAKSVTQLGTDYASAYTAVVKDVTKQLGAPEANAIQGALPAGVFDWLGAKGAHLVQFYKSTTTETWIFEQQY